MALRHVVLFRIHDDVPDDEVDRAVAALRALGDADGVLDWRVELSADTRKGRVVVEDAVLRDAGALARLRAGAAHASVAERMSRIADWLVGDYELPSPGRATGS